MLVHPPLDDPTIPYHSTAYLKGHLQANGFVDVTMRDINVEYVNHTLTSDTVNALYGEAESRLSRLRQSTSLSYQEQEMYYGLLATNRIEPSEIAAAVSNLRNKETFLDFRTYLQSLNTLTGYYAFLGALSYPSENRGFTQMSRGRFSVGCLFDLMNRELSEAICFPFTQYFYNTIAHDPQFKETDLFGISIVYDHQLCHALHFARLLRQQWPEKKIVLGGTAVTQLYKYMLDKSNIRKLFACCEALVVGEGETAICEIVDSGGNVEGRKFTNTITYTGTDEKSLFPDIKYENVSTLGAPTYDHPWELYLSPERGINYSPTRGCYWNRCTFCDYGLNTDKPTSPWRERKVDQVIRDLSAAQEQFGVNYVYFAVDVMAPGYLERLSDAIVASGLNMRWAAELRMEKIFSEERARKMAEAGCVCVSFGMESGNQRILDLIDKGTKVDYMAATMKNFATAGIACQLMAFTDFPTETPAEKNATYQFIHDTEEYWSAGGLGTFLLTGTSIIAKNPEKFGITIIETKDADVRRAVAYRVDEASGQRVGLTEDADASFDDDGGIFPPVLGRPWAGGTDSLHTMIYYNAHGREFFKTTALQPTIEVQEIQDEDVPGFTVVVNGRLVESTFDLSSIIKNRKAFLEYLNARVGIPAEPVLTSFKDWASTLLSLDPKEAASYWLVLGKTCINLDKLVYRVLYVASKTPVTVGDIMKNVPESVRERLFQYFKDLEAKGFISYKSGELLIKRAVKADPSVVAHRTKRTKAKPSWRIETPQIETPQIETPQEESSTASNG